MPIRKKVWILFYKMLYISAFTFGGGFVIVTLMKKTFVEKLGWIAEEEMTDVTAIAQSAPGAIAVNAAIMVGRRVAGVPGVAFAVLGTIIPPLVIISVISLFYRAFINNQYVAMVLKGMQAGAVAVIMDVACDMGKPFIKEKKVPELFLTLSAFIAVFFLKINVILVIAAAALIGVLRGIYALRKEKKK